MNDEKAKGFQSFLHNLENDGNEIVVGGQIISPTARLVGETSFKPAEERGWMSAMIQARHAEGQSDEERLTNTYKIAVEAIKRGVLTEEQVNAKLSELGIDTNRQQSKQETSSTQPSEQRVQPIKIDYAAIGRQLPIDENRPRKPEEYFAPGVGNLFKDTDNPTLAGRMVGSLYDKLIERSGVQPYKDGEVQQLLEVSKQKIGEFDQLAQAVNQRRLAAGLPSLSIAINRAPGSDGFHLNGSTRASQDFLFYFNKSTEHFKQRGEPTVRAYVTLKPEEQESIQTHFVDLVTRLYDAGVDFSGKAASLFGVRKRTDNIVLYISVSDQPKAAQIIKNFLQEKKIGQGHVLAAIPSPQDGLSWAMEPNEQQNKLWQQISGSTERTSFNALVAAMAMPEYLDRLAKLHRGKGDVTSAETFEAEAKRIRAIQAAA